MSKPFTRSLNAVLAARLREPRRFIQILAGPRQVGKTTSVQRVLASVNIPSQYASADQPQLRDRAWLEQQWELGRLKVASPGRSAILALDEIQKVSGWSEVVKRLWDEDTLRATSLQVVLLGSSELLIQKGLTESLAGRFELIYAPHWSLAESQSAFGWDVDTFVFYGGYPGAAPLIADPERWSQYILSSLIETTVSRDILLMVRVDKPALLRQLFNLSCVYSGQVLSYQKMLGQLQDAGNTTTLAHYLDLLNGAGLVAGLPKFAGQAVRRRGSSPKLQVYNNALITAQGHDGLESWRRDPARWGRLIESAVGAHLINASRGGGFKLYYWLDRNREVDFVIHRDSLLIAIEVKSGRQKTALPGIEAFCQAHPGARPLLVGGDGLPVEEFLRRDVSELIKSLE